MSTKTDFEVFKELFERLGLNPEMHQDITDGDICISLNDRIKRTKKDSPVWQGYIGFEVSLNFDSQGKLKSFGAYE